jgi:ribosomal protein S18 acetylase RimI-like enzyme
MTTGPAFTGKVRRAAASDVQILGKLAAELVRFHHEIDPERFFLPSGVEEGYRRWLGTEIENVEAIVLVAELRGEVVGYIYGRLEKRDFNMLLSTHAALHDVLVIERARRSGAAAALIEAFAAAATDRGMPRVVLHTATSNTQAQALFKKLGFRDTMLEMTLETGSKKSPTKKA